jgi:hypothetical protein
MKIDSYTKAVLTVIAACLVWLCVKSSGDIVVAQSQPTLVGSLPAQPVVVVGWGRLNPAVVGGIEIDWSDSQRRVSETSLTVRPSTDARFDPLRVRVENQTPVPVSVDSVRQGRDWDPLRTQVEKDPPQLVPGIITPR